MRSRHPCRIVACLALSWLAACGGSGGGDDGPIVIAGRGVERIESAMQGVMNRHAPPGISVAVVRQGRLVYANAWGTADLAGNEPLTPGHRFRVASVSKPITGIAVMRAMEEGLLDIDAPAFDILSSFLPAAGADPAIGEITVRQLLSHTGGWDFYGYPSDPLFRSLEVAQATGSGLPPDPNALTRWVAMQPLAFAPGTNFSYTNIGYVVLGRVLEASTGYLYGDFVQQFVMNPAGIDSAALGGITRAERLPDEVEYESFRNDIWKSVFDGNTVASEPAYGGLNLLGFDASSAWVVSAVDLARLAAATDGDANYPDILSPQSVDLMTTRGTPAGTSAVGVAWFLGVNAAGNATEWNHAGGMPGTISFLGRLPSGVIVAVVTNTARGDEFQQDLVGGLVEAVNGISDWPESDLFPDF